MKLTPTALESFFYLADARKADAAMEVDWTELSEPATATRWLEAYRGYIGAPDADVAGTYFASFLGAVSGGFHASLLLDGTELSFGPGNVRAQLFGPNARPPMVAALAPSARAPAADRSPAGELAAAARFYREAIRPIVEAASAATGARAIDIWRLLATRLAYIEDAITERSDEETARRVRTHFRSVATDIPGDAFGRSRNPLDVEHRFVPHPTAPGAVQRQKAACCLAYKTNHGYCYTCPRLSDDDRARKREAIVRTQ
ncbi:(2Fe-2S)-binding protein [Paenibacillus sp.]|uniref:(2Fe-2S)-binding protein n=1 Tax=Paenibacillus sp. TaxID=58172 RepID=UPI002D4656C8|nr:(2Fe-2S)-binding protein [Paenibacillus sp.]HZG58663.1 (2Fe-2S)-binding protein [Paenibacillus sp.]